MSDTRKIIDFAAEDNAVAFRDALYSAIHDRVTAHIEAKKQEVAQNLITRNESVELEEGKMDKATLSSLWHKHADHSYRADQGYGLGHGSMEHNERAATAIENHVRKHYGNKVADDMVSHSDHHVAHVEYAGADDAQHHEKEMEKLRKKHNITGDHHGMRESVELDEKNNSHTHAAHYENDKGEWTGMNLLTAKDDQDAIRQAHEKCKDGCRLSRVERHTAVKEGYELDERKYHGNSKTLIRIDPQTGKTSNVLRSPKKQSMMDKIKSKLHLNGEEVELGEGKVDDLEDARREKAEKKASEYKFGPKPKKTLATIRKVAGHSDSGANRDKEDDDDSTHNSAQRYASQGKKFKSGKK